MATATLPFPTRFSGYRTLIPAASLILLICCSVEFNRLGPSLVEARCGFPELPFQAQPTEQSQTLLEWEFFEEGRLMKVDCQNGLVGWNLDAKWIPPSSVNDSNEQLQQQQQRPHQQHSLLKIDTTAWIQCWNNQWNSSGLHCLERVDLAASDVEVKLPLSSSSAAAPSMSDNVDLSATTTTETTAHSLIDNNASSCVDIDDDYFDRHAKDGTEQKIVFSIRLPTNENSSDSDEFGQQQRQRQRRRIPRLVLLIKKHIDQQTIARSMSNSNSFNGNAANDTSAPSGGDQHQPNIASLEQLILRMNHQANMSDTAGTHPVMDPAVEPEGSVEVEEAKRFLDFVYLTEFSSDNSDKLVLLGSESKTTTTTKNNLRDMSENYPHDVDPKQAKFEKELNEISKSIETPRYSAKIAVRLTSSQRHLVTGKQTSCSLNEDATVLHGTEQQQQQIQQLNSTTDSNISSEFLVFNCPLGVKIRSSSDSSDTILIEVYFKARQPDGGTSPTADITPMFQLCSVETIAVTDSDCGKPYIPIYGLVNETGTTTTSDHHHHHNREAIYTCAPNYIAINLTKEMDSELSPLSAMLRLHQQGNHQSGMELKPNSLHRFCDRHTGQWTPRIEDIHCFPRATCRRTPPLFDGKKFYFEYSRLDHLNRAIVGVSMATLRCQMLTDYVAPFVMFTCDRNGEWTRLGTALMDNKTINEDPVCKSALFPVKGATAGSGGGRRGSKSSHYYHHYYHHYYNRNQLINSVQTNRTSMVLFGRQLNDNKNLIYYGVAGLVVLFGGSFIILFHVRRMAKKISNQMRARSYLSTGEKVGYGGYQVGGMSGAMSGSDESFMAMSGGGGGGNDGNLPPYYNNESNYYDGNTMFSNDLPPPTTPISMPAHVAHQGMKSDRGGGGGGNNLSANFDSIKF